MRRTLVRHTFAHRFYRMYYIVYPLLYLLSLLPFFILYGISDLFAFLLRVVFRYRKQVVLSNLQTAFPEKTEEERKLIARKFYQYFTDSFIEMLKFLSISRKELLKRTSTNFEIVDKLLAEGKNVNLICGHQFNWEYANLLYSAVLNVPFVTIYHALQNKTSDRLMLKIRRRFGAILVSTDGFGGKMHTVFKNQYALVLAADQSPSNPKKGYWLNFFGKPTAFLVGPEKSAMRNKVPVVFVGFKKIKRGYYHFEPVLLTENGALTEKGEITKLYRDELEKAIAADPANYLWSHRRFKYDWKEEYGPMIG